MRFHMGISFRLKSLKKFLFPFLVGLLAYFGLSSFNIMKVQAYNSNSSYYEFEYEEMDFSNIQTNGDYSFKDILDITQIPSDYYFIYSLIVREYNSISQSVQYGLKIYLIPKENQFINGQFYGFINSNNNNTIDMYHAFNNINSQRVYYYTTLGSSINTSFSTQDFSNIYNALNNCLSSNVCDSNYLAYSNDTPGFYLDSFTGSISNTQSYIINYKNLLFDNFNYELRFMPYYKNITIKNYNQVSTTPTYIYKKLIKINDSVISSLSDMPTYCDYFDCSSVDNDTNSYNDVNTKFQSLYSILDINNLSGTLFNIYYKVPNADLYTEKIDRFVNLFYGRIDHGTYYSYENINCSITIDNNNDISNNVIDYTLHNVNCSNVDLTRYDKILFYHSIRFQSDDLDKSILSLNIGSNLDFKYGVYKGLIYDKLDIPNNYNYIFSSSSISWVAMYFSSNDSHVSYDLFSNDPNYTNTLSNKSLLSCSIDTGNFVNEIGLCFKKFGMYVYNYNLIIFNNNTNMQDSYIEVYYSDDSIIASYGYTGDTFYYYDNTGTLVNDALSFDYEEQFYDNDYDSINSIFDDINNYFNGINEDLGKLHTIINNIYVSIPISYRYPLNIFYIIGLIYILYREIKR